MTAWAAAVDLLQVAMELIAPKTLFNNQGLSKTRKKPQ